MQCLGWKRQLNCQAGVGAVVLGEDCSTPWWWYGLLALALLTGGGTRAVRAYRARRRAR